MRTDQRQKHVAGHNYDRYVDTVIYFYVTYYHRCACTLSTQIPLLSSVTDNELHQNLHYKNGYFQYVPS
jgi:hypothetical protein